MQNDFLVRVRPTPGRRLRASTKPLRRASLLVGTAFLLTAAPARAANECGAPPPGGGTVTCPAGEYPTGIDYVTPDALEILLAPGVVTRGTSSIDVSGDFRLIGPIGTSLNFTPSDPAGSRALYAETDGSAFIRLDKIGDSIGGIAGGGGVVVRASTFIDFSANSVATIDDGSPAILLFQLGAPVPPASVGISVQAGTVVTAGDGSSGIYLSTANGSAKIVAGTVTTEGYGSGHLQRRQFR